MRWMRWTHVRAGFAGEKARLEEGRVDNRDIEIDGGKERARGSECALDGSRAAPAPASRVPLPGVHSPNPASASDGPWQAVRRLSSLLLLLGPCPDPPNLSRPQPVAAD